MQNFFYIITCNSKPLGFVYLSKSAALKMMQRINYNGVYELRYKRMLLSNSYEFS